MKQLIVKSPLLVKIGVIAIMLLLFGLVNPQFIRYNTFFLISLVTLPITLGKPKSQPGIALFLLMIVLSLFGLLIPTTTGVFVFLALMILYLIGYDGKINLPTLIHVSMITPLFLYISSLISFPLRIYLSQTTSWLLHFFWETNANGNVISLNGQEFLVDQACAGLFMLEYGLLFGTVILGWRSQRWQQSWWQYLSKYGILLGLILLANVIRIICLVVFNIGADHWLHETIGLAIYTEVVLIPFYWLSSKWLKQYKNPTISTQQNSQPILRPAILMALYLLLLFRNIKDEIPQQLPQTTLQGYESKVLESGVVQLNKSDALIYIKPPVAGFKSDHNPTICWKGSGFEFKKISETKINNQPVNIAELHKKGEVLYSAWWFESLETRTINQWTWRKASLLDHQSFYLVNITCRDMATLKSNLMIIMDSPSLFKKENRNSINT